MKIKISAIFEGKCSFCKKKQKRVFTAGDEDTHTTVTICHNCSEKSGNMSISEMIEKHGVKNEKAFQQGVKYHKKPTAG